MSTNNAAYTLSIRQPLVVKPAPYPTTLKPNTLVIRNRALAINPVDWIIRDVGTSLSFSWLKAPYIFGHDVAGEVVSVGSNVTRFKVGDRVVGHATATDEKINDNAYGGFQEYVVLLDKASSLIPDDMTYETASVIPLGLGTASGGLFEKDQLALQYPSVEPKPTGKTLLIWGGSTSVGCNAIQLAVAAGYEVYTTCSPKNFDVMKKLGASQVFDYRDPEVVKKIVSAMNGKTTAGALAIGHNSATLCLDVISQCKGNKHVSMATVGPATPPKHFPVLQTMYSAVTSMTAITVKAKLRGIRTSFIWGSSLINSDVGPAVYVDYLQEALATKKFVAAPEPLVVGHGLESVQEAMEIQKKGVSMKKIVVSLD